MYNMQVKTHHGFEDLNEARINEVIQHACEGLDKVNWVEIASRCKVQWYDGITTDELAEATIMAASSMIEVHPQYDYVAARLLLRKIEKEKIPDGFTSYVFDAVRTGRLDPRMMSGQQDSSNPGVFDVQLIHDAIKPERDTLFKYQGVRILYDRYLLRDSSGRLLETPQWMWMRVAMGIALGESANHADWAIRFYDATSTFDYMPSTPTLFNAGTTHPQMASCYVTHAEDSLESIFNMYGEVAQMSKWAGGVGVNYTSLRSTGAKIKGTNGEGTGIVPWAKIHNDIAIAVNQGGKRKGSHCVYLETWHADIEEFIDLRKNIGDERRRTHDLNTAHWIPDLFMERVQENELWTLFDPSECPELSETWGTAFNLAYERYENEGRGRKTMPAVDLWRKMLTSIFETGHPWICFKDTVNSDNPMKAIGMVRSSNLCVAPETLVLTDRGHLPILSLIGKTVNVWNGTQFSTVTPVQTGTNQPLLTVRLSDGSALDTTAYHKFLVKNNYWKDAVEVEAKDLKPGDKMIKFGTPVVPFGEDIPDAYTQGLFSADGCRFKEKNHVDLYGPKRELAAHINFRSEQKYQEGPDRQRYMLDNSYVKFSVPSSASVQSRLDWLAGFIDGDGTLVLNGSTPALQIGSIHPEFLGKVKLMLQTLGVQSKVTLSKPRGIGIQGYMCQAAYRLLIGASGVKQLSSLGLSTKRVLLPQHTPDRNAEQFTTVTEVVNTGRVSDTYCFTEPLLNRAVFNGVLTSQCTEITLNTGPGETAVCNLGSINIGNFYDRPELDLKNTVTLAVRMLDNIIDQMFYPTEAAAKTNKANRPIGLGLMGWQDYLFKKGELFDSKTALGVAEKYAEAISEWAEIASYDLAIERGPFPNHRDSTVAGRRNSHLTAIAPTATISNITGASSCIEPIFKNLYVTANLSGDFTNINSYLVHDLEALGLWDEEMLNQLKVNDGSVQNIARVPDNLKLKYRTAFEYDQKALIDLAAARQPYITQSQSLNLFVKAPVSGKVLSDLYMRAWEQGLKTTYYLRTEAASGVEKSTIDPNKYGKTHMSQTPIMPQCKIDDPGCESCS